VQATIYLSDGATLTILDFDPATVMDLAAELHEAHFATFAMDEATVIVNTAYIVRIDLG
jgi:hypothetical protein